MAQKENQLCCPNCSSKDIDYDEKSGSAVCTVCGVVVEENAIVSSIEFSEAGGTSQVIGQFVSQSMTKPYSSSGSRRGGRFGFSRDSRETTLSNGRRRIQDVASRLKLGSHHVDSAHRYFQIAVEKNFVQGRKTTHVVAACLYIACRQQKTQHMLIDFSDALQVNVYTLGCCFLKFRRLLGLKLDIIDPALYIYRFASYLELGEKANAVALTALRVVARMKRDWIVAGRRPAGVCAASLLIASRAHGFTRTQSDVTKILRICNVTVNTRIKEFELLPSAQLTFEQFNTIDMESEANPPSFTKNRMSELRNKAFVEGDTALLTSDACLDPLAPKARNKGRTKNRKVDAQIMYDELEKDLASNEDSTALLDNAPASTSSAASSTKVVASAGSGGEIVPIATNLVTSNHDGKIVTIAHPKQATSSEMQMAIAKSQNIVPYDPLTSSCPGSSTIGGKSYATYEERIDLKAWIQSIPRDSAINSEIKELIRSEEDEKEKVTLFEEMNADYLKRQKDKEDARIETEKAEKKKQDELTEQQKSKEAYRNTRKKDGDDRGRGKASRAKRKRKGIGTTALDIEASQSMSGDIQSAVTNTLASRRVSRKINYDAMSKIFKDDGHSFESGKADRANQGSAASASGRGKRAKDAANNKGTNGGRGKEKAGRASKQSSGKKAKAAGRPGRDERVNADASVSESDSDDDDGGMFF